MKTYEVKQRVSQWLVYHVEAESKEDAVAQVCAGSIPEAYETSSDANSIRVRVLHKKHTTT